MLFLLLSVVVVVVNAGWNKSQQKLLLDGSVQSGWPKYHDEIHTSEADKKLMEIERRFIVLSRCEGRLASSGSWS